MTWIETMGYRNVPNDYM